MIGRAGLYENYTDPRTLNIGKTNFIFTWPFRLDDVEDAVNINTKLSQTVKAKDEKIESLETKSVFILYQLPLK